MHAPSLALRVSMRPGRAVWKAGDKRPGRAVLGRFALDGHAHGRLRYAETAQAWNAGGPAEEKMSTTTFHEGNATRTWGAASSKCSQELIGQYRALIEQERMSWTEHHKLIRLLGQGGQGVVYLSQRRGTDNFTLPVALKVFSPERYDEAGYDDAMGRLAHVAAHIALIQQDNLLDVHNWVERHRIRIMEMEWIDGFDLRRLLTPAMLGALRARAAPERWRAITEVVVTEGPSQPRLKPGVAMAVVRDCLSALHALHRAGVIHADIKPANLMVKRAGNAKVVDLGSAFQIDDPPARHSFTPMYAAPEVLDGGCWSPQADLASVGYVLIEMLAGVLPFAGLKTYGELLQAKRDLPQRLPEILPQEVVRNDLLMNFCCRLVAPDPVCRFLTAEQAEHDPSGAAGFHRQLVKGDLSSEYDKEIRVWLENLGDAGLGMKDER